MNVSLLNEHGAQLERFIDEEGRVGDLIPYEDGSYAVLHLIDPYGDTVFARGQMIPFLDDWKRFSSYVSDASNQTLLSQVEELAVKCQRGDGDSLKFYGE